MSVRRSSTPGRWRFPGSVAMSRDHSRCQSWFCRVECMMNFFLWGYSIHWIPRHPVADTYTTRPDSRYREVFIHFPAGYPQHCPEFPGYQHMDLRHARGQVPRPNGAAPGKGYQNRGVGVCAIRNDARFGSLVATHKNTGYSFPSLGMECAVMKRTPQNPCSSNMARKPWRSKP